MNDSQQARQELVSECKSLAESIVRSYYPPGPLGPEWDDLIQEANLALCQAAAEYDPNSNGHGNGRASFKTYAFFWIIGRVTRATRPLKAKWLKDGIDLDQIAAPSPDTFRADHLERMWAAFEELSSIEQNVLIYRFGLRGRRHRTREETSARMKISVSTVKRAERRAIDGLEVRLRIFPED